MDKHSSLFGLFANDEKKNYISKCFELGEKGFEWRELPFGI